MSKIFHIRLLYLMSRRDLNQGNQTSYQSNTFESGRFTTRLTVVL